jgi:Glutamate synthase domain 2
MLDSDAVETRTVTIGESYSKYPYAAKSIFNISGMSYGAISKPAVLALSAGAKIADCWMNTGEGGLSPYHLEGGADLVFQIGTAKYGVRHEDGSLDDQKLADIAEHDQVKMFEIKVSQGAKPGKGGILPGVKVTEEISIIRGIPKGVESNSPNRHVEISNASELLDMINHVRDVTEKPVGFKTVIGHIRWLEALLDEVNKRGIQSAPDFITVDGGDGGTGAAPMALMDNVGLPLKEALPLVVDKIMQCGLEDRIKVVASGKMITPSDVAWAICAGADFVTSARGFMFAIGCIQSLKCNKNTCPNGVLQRTI